MPSGDRREAQPCPLGPFHTISVGVSLLCATIFEQVTVPPLNTVERSSLLLLVVASSFDASGLVVLDEVGPDEARRRSRQLAWSDGFSWVGTGMSGSHTQQIQTVSHF